MGTTIHDVARQAGVSISTVSRVLNGTCHVAEDKRSRVEAAATALGYVPNPAALSLLRQQTGGIGVLLPFVGGEFFSEFLNGIDRVTQNNEHFLLISSSHRSAGEFMAALRGLHRRVDGLLVMATEMEADELREHLPPDVPIVFVNTKVRGTALDVINFDNFGGAYAMTTHLVQRGHRRIAMIKGPDSANDARDRLAGFRSALHGAGLAVDEALVVPGEFSQEAGYEATARLLALDAPPTAIVACNDYCAMGALRALHEAGLSIPADMAVGGFDNITSAAYTNPPLSTVRVPLSDLGIRAIECLLSRIHGYDGPPEEVVLPVELIIRSSTGDAGPSLS